MVIMERKYFRDSQEDFYFYKIESLDNEKVEPRTVKSDRRDEINWIIHNVNWKRFNKKFLDVYTEIIF